MARLDLYTKIQAAKYLGSLLEHGGEPQQFKDVQAALQKETNQHIDRAQLRRIAKQAKVDFNKVIVAPAGKTSLLATAHTNLTTLARRVEVMEQIVAELVKKGNTI